MMDMASAHPELKLARLSPAGPLFAGALLLAFAHLAIYYPRLPQTVASHFDNRGNADGWSSKTLYASFLAVVYLVIAALFLGVKVSMSRFPARLLNVPNRDYWLSPQREQRTRTALSRSTLYLGSATLLLLIAISEMSFRANFTSERSMGYAPWYALAAYVVFTFGWMGRLLWRLRRAPPLQDAESTR
jgi:uncharacterized membrane protein